jgi:5-methylcytosine-specific restriction endonuclease McrA
MRAPKVCSTPGCPHTQPCPDHPKIPWANSTRRTELPKDWASRRATVLRRDPTCTLGTTCAGLALSVEVHHIGDKHNHALNNLAGVCTNCHRAETQQQASTARRTPGG